MTKASDNAFPSLLITEGTEPSAPAAGKQRLYIDSTSHHLKRTNSSGTDVDIEGASITIPVGAKIVRVAADYTTSSGTLADVDAANLTINLTTLARRVMVGVVATGANSNATGRCDLAFKIDGSVPNGAHIEVSQHSETSNFMNLSYIFLTDVLTAASHAFVLQFARGAAGTFTLNANATNNLEFWAVETLLTA